MPDTLEVFGKEWLNVNGIKAYVIDVYKLTPPTGKTIFAS